MASSYGTTHERILHSGKALFLANGYERTNLRELCRNAGVTTGAFYRHFNDKESLFAALVDAVILGMEARYDQAKEECWHQLEHGDLQSAWAKSLQVHEEFVRYIHENRESFKLLLECSEGTRYQNFMDAILEKELLSSLQMCDLLDSLEIPYKRPGDKEMVLLIKANYNCLFETVLHDMTIEEALVAGRVVADFFSAGWREILGLGDMSFLDNLMEKWRQAPLQSDDDRFATKVSMMDVLARLDPKSKEAESVGADETRNAKTANPIVPSRAPADETEPGTGTKAF